MCVADGQTHSGESKPTSSNSSVSVRSSTLSSVVDSMTIGCVFEISGFFTPRTQPPPLLASCFMRTYSRFRCPATRVGMAMADLPSSSVMDSSFWVYELRSIRCSICAFEKSIAAVPRICWTRRWLTCRVLMRKSPMISYLTSVGKLPKNFESRSRSSGRRSSRKSRSSSSVAILGSDGFARDSSGPSIRGRA